MGKIVEYKELWLKIFNEYVTPLELAFLRYANEPSEQAKAAVKEFSAFVQEARKRIDNSKTKIKKGTQTQAATEALNQEKVFLTSNVQTKTDIDTDITNLLSKLDREGEFTKNEIDEEINPLNIKVNLALYKLLVLCMEKRSYTSALQNISKSDAGESPILLLDTALRRRIHYVGIILDVFAWYRSEMALIALQPESAVGEAYDALVERADDFKKNYETVLFPEEDKKLVQEKKLCTVTQFLTRFEKLFLKYHKLALAKNAERLKPKMVKESSPAPLAITSTGTDLTVSTYTTPVGDQQVATSSITAVTTTATSSDDAAPAVSTTAVDGGGAAPKTATPPTSPRAGQNPGQNQESSRLWHFVGIGAVSVVSIGVAFYMASYIPALRPVTKPIMNLGNRVKESIRNIISNPFGRA